jgi:hypothetical protein
MQRVITALGLLMIAASIAGTRISFHRLLDEWRKAEPRVWAGMMRPAHRAFPFSVFARSRATQHYGNMWLTYTPEWAAGRPEARKWLRRYRWSMLLFPPGFFIAMAPLLVR